MANIYTLRAFFSGQWSSTARLEGKTVIITGANTGIGKETAKDLAKRGARIILACRDVEKAETALKEIIDESGNQSIVVRKLDLSDTKSIKEFADVIKKEESQVNILINNAGVMMCPYSKTADGFEMQFGVNHLGSGVNVYVVHPGVVRTELKRHMNIPLLIMWKVVRPFTKTIVQGAQTSIYCAVEPTLDTQSGEYYSNCAPASCSRAARDDDVAEKLWDLSCQMLGITWE